MIRERPFGVVHFAISCKNKPSGMQTIKFIHSAEIERQAREVLVAAEITAAPIDPVQIAASAGIEVFSIDFADDSVCGILRLEGEKYCIYVNQDHHRLRMRYTIAHELV